MRRYAMRRDENEPEIIAALEAIGCTVCQLDEPCDLLVGRGAKNILIEVKNPEGDGKKTPNQKTFSAGWRGQYAIVETADQAIDVVQKLTVKNLL